MNKAKKNLRIMFGEVFYSENEFLLHLIRIFCLVFQWKPLKKQEKITQVIYIIFWKEEIIPCL